MESGGKVSQAGEKKTCEEGGRRRGGGKDAQGWGRARSEEVERAKDGERIKQEGGVGKKKKKKGGDRNCKEKKNWEDVARVSSREGGCCSFGFLVFWK